MEPGSSIDWRPSASGSSDRTPPSATRSAKMGAWLQLAPLIGTALTAHLLIRAVFANVSTMGNNRMSETDDPTILSENIGEALIGTHLGLMLSLIGCVLLGFAIFKQGNQPPWVKIIFGVSVLPALSATYVLTLFLTT